MRKYYIDNLRWMSILLLIPYHTFMIYNSFGESFYIKGADIPLVTGVLVAIWPWFMPLLFVCAGLSSAFALQKRSVKQYIKERALKLLVPFFFGILLLIPAQTFFAERFHNGYTGGYFRQYIIFFTKPTDFTGYNGGFTPGQLWFILYLFVISLVALPIMNAYRRANRRTSSSEDESAYFTGFIYFPSTRFINIGYKW
jgi:Acyltransferase family.